MLLENKAIVENPRFRDELLQESFGELIERKLVLDLNEALYLLKKGRIKIKHGKKDLTEETLLNMGISEDKRFYTKYLVFEDLRSKGYVVKTGYKFGFDFRVYPKGKKPGEAHTQYVVNVCKQNDVFKMHEMSRMIRLSGNINTLLVQAVVDSENHINYYQIIRSQP
ncbi:MAG: tRNA-intron lyase [Candidatus Diapherotrites archaeon]|nr:tRNA-intron lyase [Candidatus Diapherotrites archaeon]